MIYESIRTGKRLFQIQGNLSTNPDVKERKEPDNHVCMDLFKIGTRVRFKGTQGNWMKQVQEKAFTTNNKKQRIKAVKHEQQHP
jgi:hypothetical protein